MSKLRFRVIETAFRKKAVEMATPTERPSEYFGKQLSQLLEHIDKLELIADNQMWTLPKYREPLFIR